MACDIPFIFDYMRRMRVGGAYSKVAVDGQHRFIASVSQAEPDYASVL